MFESEFIEEPLAPLALAGFLLYGMVFGFDGAPPLVAVDELY